MERVLLCNGRWCEHRAALLGRRPKAVLEEDCARMWLDDFGDFGDFIVNKLEHLEIREFN